MTNEQPGAGETRQPVVRIGGRYELGGMLGRGGMAEVRKGTDIRLGRVVAVKRLRTDLASDPTFQARFRREAQSSASLNHPSIVAVYDTGEEMSLDGTDVAQPYIVMEYVAGRTLREILREGRKILPERALEITSGVLSALDYSHRAGIIHRDIKPANVMLTPAGDVKVMDFGIARAVAETTSAITQTAAVIGTAQYLSPEQARGETVDSRSDVYSAGCLLYELLTGRPPFVGDSPVAVAYQHVREQAEPPSALDPELPPEVDSIVMKALAKRVEDRYQSAAAMRADIERYLAGKPIVAPVVPVDGDGGFLPTATDTPATESTSIFQGAALTEEGDRKKSKWPLILLGLGILALFVAALVLGPILLGGGETEERSVPGLAGMTQQQAAQTLDEADLTLGEVTREASADVPRGRVISQDPERGDFLPPGDEVNVIISTGRPDVTMPDVLGENKDAARRELVALGLKVELISEESDEERNTVTNTDPRPATQISAGSTVEVFFSEGPTEVPDVIGMSERRARRVLANAGFEVTVSYDPNTRATKGLVIEQAPEPFSEQPTGTTIVITVSTYDQPSPSPSETPDEEETPTQSPSPTVSPSLPTVSPSISATP